MSVVMDDEGPQDRLDQFLDWLFSPVPVEDEHEEVLGHVEEHEPDWPISAQELEEDEVTHRTLNVLERTQGERLSDEEAQGSRGGWQW